ncbi:MAG TPA: amino acid ABC transporter substrate-binding protein [Desulfobulbus sp.]|nr:amino acid ABC transporter substrate-binding protein [Desulfobulbus sp.]
MYLYSTARERQHPVSAALAAVLLALAFLLASCSREKEPVRIGLAINLSGDGGPAAEHIRDGARLGVETVNRHGGINGHPLELLVRDDRNDPDDILAVDQDLINRGVPVIMGHSISQNTLVAYPLVTGQNVLLFTAYTATSKLSNRDDLFFRTSVDTTIYGRAMAGLLHRAGITRISALLDLDNASFSEDYLRQIRKNYSGAVNRVTFHARKETDWNRISARLLKGDPQAVIMLANYRQTAIIAQKLRQAGATFPFYATLWDQSPCLIHIGGRAVEGIRILTFIAPEYDNDQYHHFARLLERRYLRQPTAKSMRGYEMVQILARAMRAVPYPPSAEAIKQQLLATTFTTLLGRVRFNRYGDVRRPLYLVTVRNGRFVQERVLDPATATP